MQNESFSLSDYEPEARLARLSLFQAESLESALSQLTESGGSIQGRTGSERESLPEFLLCLAESGLNAEQMIRLARLVPAGYPLDHREIYFDFRLHRWIRHIEPLSVSECLDEYFRNAESHEQGLGYLADQWQAFLRRHGGDA